MSWIVDNFGTFMVLALVVFVAYLAARSLIKNKKARKSSCGCGCSHCAMSGMCHGNNKTN